MEGVPSSPLQTTNDVAADGGIQPATFSFENQFAVPFNIHQLVDLVGENDPVAAVAGRGRDAGRGRAQDRGQDHGHGAG